MATATIPRMKFREALEGSLTAERTKLANDAVKVLGYSQLAKAISAPGELLAGLKKLGIQPLVQREVYAYQAKKAKNGMWSGHKHGIAWWASIPGLLAMAEGFYRLDPRGIHVFPVTMGLVCLLGSIMGLFRGMLLLFSENARGHRVTRDWRMTKIQDYDGNVPEFALERALQVKTEVPEANLYVERLYEDVERITRPSPDPFLVAMCGTESYYLDVWDEKEYEATL